MNTDYKKAFEKYEKMLLKASEYSGRQGHNEKIFSASMLGNDVLQNYLKIKYPPSKQHKFRQNSLGSIYQLGVDNAVKLWNNDKKIEDYKSALRLEYKLSNGWIISGEIDQIDWENKIIFDNKMITETRISKIKKDGKNDSYSLQLSVYRFLMNKKYEKDFKCAIASINKTFSDYRSNKADLLTFIEVETLEPDETERLLLNKTNELDKYLDNDIEPDECENKYWFRKGMVNKPMRCLLYCDYSKHCKFYNDYKNRNGNNTLLRRLEVI